jgi:hypothetical protein
MIQAARSGKQNIIEGSTACATSQGNKAEDYQRRVACANA